MDEVAQESSEKSSRREELFSGTVSRLVAPISHYLTDKTDPVSEVLINGPGEIYIERRGRLIRVEEKFRSADELEAAARAIAQFSGKMLTGHELSVEARLPDKSRVHIVLPPASRNGLSIAIRRFQKAYLTLDSLVKNGAIAPDVMEFLEVCTRLRKNLLISGGTSTGKTTFINALTECVDDDERVIVIEDVNELAIAPRHALYFEAQKPDRFGRGGITIRELFRASLRMRPDRIIVGECRGGEALDMIQAMTSGHSGSVTTLHADTPLDALQRLETMALMSDVDLPQKPLRQQIVQAVDVIVQLQRLHSTRQRAVVQVAEVIGVDDLGRFLVEDVFERTEAVETRASPEDTTPLTRYTGHRVKFRKEGGFVYKARDMRLTEALWKDESALAAV